MNEWWTFTTECRGVIASFPGPYVVRGKGLVTLGKIPKCAEVDSLDL